jgi:SAM-dependent methyltransferase
MKRYKVDVTYQTNDNCPLCKGKGQEVGQLADGVYHFGNLDIPYPKSLNGRIPIKACTSCGLIFKFFVPEPESLLSVLSKGGHNVWKSNFKPGSHDVELNLIEKAISKIEYVDILDIGCSDGGLLYEFRNIPGRHSGLDIIISPKCKEYVSGELIEAFIDSDFSWSGTPYDVVTAFDLLEHLYEPNKAFLKFTQLLKSDGVLVVQTGNPRFARGNYGGWWYLRLFEHHICWPEETLISLAHRYGFTISLTKTQHKGRIAMPFWKENVLWMANRFRKLNLLQTFILIFLGRDIRTLADPFSKDHLTFVLRKNGNIF